MLSHPITVVNGGEQLTTEEYVRIGDAILNGVEVDGFNIIKHIESKNGTVSSTTVERTSL